VKNTGLMRGRKTEKYRNIGFYFSIVGIFRFL